MVHEAAGRRDDRVAVHQLHGDGHGLRRRRRDAAHRALAVEARAHHTEPCKLAEGAVVAAARRVVQARAAHEHHRAAAHGARRRIEPPVRAHVLVLEARAAPRVLLLVLRHLDAHQPGGVLRRSTPQDVVLVHCCIDHSASKFAFNVRQCCRTTIDASYPDSHNCPTRLLPRYRPDLSYQWRCARF